MDQIGFVSRIEGDRAEVIVRRVSSCGDKCTSCKGGCSVPGIKTTIKNTLGAKPGDYVEIRMNTSIVLKSAFLVYVLPLILMIFGISLSIYLFKNMGYNNYENLGFIAGLLFLGFSFIILRLYDKKIKKNENYKFEMVRILK
ncbi:positive regulator of sigma(E), RseC/MucC [Caloranaerobacter azorensis DSM 13643]|uniref:Positive regulator of sigma(E), RseC/MucC n=1 Tax=Caloranaerobacter azorensis DSM 13643 TaxID=1121264 RepID=A0A1M5WU01_9FIRM|nr:SoxR reducing system RseC family protein [Caloranaerobacter azorensis]SHH90624.1 positive regulator of sigma(E), RseC/MucC [Caloranaerobacter azorensis DSM 13643]